MTMKKRQRPLKTKHECKSDQNLHFFLENYTNCHLLYHADTQPQPTQNFSQEMRMIQYVFSNEKQLQRVKTPLSLSSNKQNSHTFLETFNQTDKNDNQEDQEYSNYLKEYETLMKCSRRKQYVSPQKQNKEINLLINQFLSDINEQSQTSFDSRPSEKTPIKQLNKTVQPQTGKESFVVKVEKIDLTNFQTKKSNSKLQGNQKSKSRRKINNNNEQKQTKSIVTKFIDINRAISKDKQAKTPREKSQSKIQVKVKQIKPKEQRIIYVNPKISTLNGGKSNVSLKNQQNGDHQYSRQQLSNGNYSHQYLKKKQQKQSRVQPSSIYLESSSKQQEKPMRKPIKIEIEIPQDELCSDPPQSQTYEEDLQLQKEGAQIIKDISEKILKLLDKTKHVTYKAK